MSADSAVAGRSSRRLGALIGVHAGDALGAGVEFSSWASIQDRYPNGPRDITGGGPFGWPPGHATDDTDLTRAVLLAYAEDSVDVVAAAASHMLDWRDGRWPDRAAGTQPVDIGGATARGLARYAETGDPRSSGAGVGQAGNGSLMRCIPTAVMVPDQQTRIAHSIELSAITHDDPRCTVSCAAYNEIAAALLDGGEPWLAVAGGLAAAGELMNEPVVEAISYGEQLDVAAAATTGQTNLADEGGGYVLDSLSIAVAAVLDERPLEDVLVDVVRLGRDTDTNAAIAGGLLGARDGVDGIPQRWRSVLQFGVEFAEILARQRN